VEVFSTAVFYYQSDAHCEVVLENSDSFNWYIQCYAACLDLDRRTLTGLRIFILVHLRVTRNLSLLRGSGSELQLKIRDELD